MPRGASPAAPGISRSRRALAALRREHEFRLQAAPLPDRAFLSAEYLGLRRGWRRSPRKRSANCPAARSRPRNSIRDAIAAWEGAPSRDPVDRLMEFFTRFYLQDDILAKTDRAAMMHSLETRAVFLDNDLVDFCRRLPRRFKYRGRRANIYCAEPLKRCCRRALLPAARRDLAFRSRAGSALSARAAARRRPRHGAASSPTPGAPLAPARATIACCLVLAQPRRHRQPERESPLARSPRICVARAACSACLPSALRIMRDGFAGVAVYHLLHSLAVIACVHLSQPLSPTIASVIAYVVEMLPFAYFPHRTDTLFSSIVGGGLRQLPLRFAVSMIVFVIIRFRDRRVCTTSPKLPAAATCSVSPRTG